MAPTDVHLRPADDADVDALAEVHVLARRAAPMPASIHPLAEVRDLLAVRLSRDEVWVAEVDDQVVGYARMTDTWLDDLYVLPTHGGRGVGSMLLDLVKALRPGGFSLWVFETNVPARGFYARHGLVEREHTDGRDNEERAPDLRMSWP